jgi:hypothetical protein
MTDGRWNQLGGVAGLGYVVVAVGAAALTGKPPAPDASAAVIRDFVVDKHAELVAQGWLYGLGAALMLWFALAVRRVLRREGRHLGDLFFVGTAVVVALLLVAMAIQIAVARAAARLSAEAVRLVGVDLGLVLVALVGFIVATTAVAYAVCVMSDAALPRWTAWLAIIAAVANLAGTFSVFVADGPFSSEGGGAAWLPALSTVVWYLGTAVALLRLNRRHTRAEQAVQGFG